MDNVLYPLCLTAEDAERSGRTERQPDLDEGQAQTAPAARSSVATVESRQAEAPRRPNEQDWANAAALVMYFAMRGGC